MTLISFGVVLFNVTGLSLFQALTPQRILGRNETRPGAGSSGGTIPLGNIVGGVARVDDRAAAGPITVGAGRREPVLCVPARETGSDDPPPARAGGAILLEELVELPLETQSAET
jgi:hypothetical protein